MYGIADPDTLAVLKLASVSLANGLDFVDDVARRRYHGHDTQTFRSPRTSACRGVSRWPVEMARIFGLKY